MKQNKLRHYTSLSSLIHILTYKKITLSNPSNWEDKNDAIYLEIYRKKRGFKRIFAMCFTSTYETSHHWKIYAPGKHGVCVIFNSDKLLGALNQNIRHGSVRYKYADEVESEGIKIDDLPFLKRKAFGDEKEYRLIYQGHEIAGKHYYQIPIEIEWIDSIYLNNSMPKDFVKSVKVILQSIKGCHWLSVIQTSLNENTRWKKAGNKAT